MTEPYIIEFPSFGSSREGFLTLSSSANLPFTVKRVFWTYHTPTQITRGRHAHHTTEMVLVAVSGSIEVHCEGRWGIRTFRLSTPESGLFIPNYCWHTMKYGTDSVQLVLANTEYDEKDYIRDYELFSKLITG